MPKILDKRVKALRREGMPEKKAWAIATASLQKDGRIKKPNTKNKRK